MPSETNKYVFVEDTLAWAMKKYADSSVCGSMKLSASIMWTSR
jgi:hypothetical protein